MLSTGADSGKLEKWQLLLVEFMLMVNAAAQVLPWGRKLGQLGKDGTGFL